MTKRSFDVANIANTSKKQKKNIDINLEEDVIKYYLMPSLQHASMSNIIITLWNQADIKYQIVNIFNECGDDLCTLLVYNTYGIYQLFVKIAHKVLDKVLQLPVPNRIRKILSNIVHPIGKELFDWIKYQDRHIFNIFNYAYPNPKSIAINYLDYLVWTARGTIDYQETAKTLLAKEEKLPDSYKYNLACAYCLEDNIAIIAPKVINTKFTLTSIRTQAMIYFWTAHITGNFTELENAVNSYNRECRSNYSINECLFKVLTNIGTNQVAIKYIWDKLSNEEKSRQIVPAIKKTPKTDIRCFLLSQMSKEQQKEVFKTYDARGMLLGFLDDWLWGQYFLPTMHHIWDIMSGQVYLCVLECVVNKMEKSHEETEKYSQYKSIFKELWKYAPKHLKEYVFEHENGDSGQSIFLSLFYKSNIDIIQLILADINDVQKKQIIFSNYGIGRCHFLITSDQWELLERLIVSTLFSKEDVEYFKCRLIIKKGPEIAEHFIQNKEWNKVEQFMQWAFKSDDDIREFKSKLVHCKICADILKSMVANNNADFMELEYFIKWCASDNAEKVVKLKKQIPKLCFYKVICKLIEKGNYDFLEQILNWCFISDPKLIAQFKQYFYQDGEIYQLIDVIVNLLEQDDQLQSFQKFVYYWCPTDEKINEFKTCLLHPMGHTVGVCIKLLCKHMFKLADDFLTWCCNSSQIQIDNYKNQLMLDDGLMYFSEEDNPAELIKWFNPSAETAIRFKEKFRNYFYVDVLTELDGYIQKQQHNQEDVTNILQDLLLRVENPDRG